MTRLNGVFDGKVVLLEQPLPPELKPNTAVEVLVPEDRERSIQEMTTFLAELWQRPIPAGIQPASKRWTREELHDR